MRKIFRNLFCVSLGFLKIPSENFDEKDQNFKPFFLNALLRKNTSN
jgi:hypothetical protein